jgi:hypothetical protein
MSILTDSMGFSAIVDRISAADTIADRDDLTTGSTEENGLDSRLYYDRDEMYEDAFETKGPATGIIGEINL